jgi:DNA-binding CsgD family transcriptional regulator
MRAIPSVPRIAAGVWPHETRLTWRKTVDGRLKDGPAKVLVDGAVGLFKSLTTRRFCAALLQHVNALVRVDHCALVRLTPRAGIQLFGAESLGAVVASGARAIVRYIDHHHRFDPIRRVLHARRTDPAIIVRRERPSEVVDAAYRRDCYEASDICDRVSLVSRDHCGGLVSLELQRQRASGEFTDAEREMLTGAAPLLAIACTRHVELLIVGGADFDAWRVRIAAACPAMTERELDVVATLLTGRTLREAAAALDLAHSSVVTYCGRAYARLGVRNLRELRGRFAFAQADSAGRSAASSAATPPIPTDQYQ